MKWLRIATLLLIPSQLLAQVANDHSPDWMVSGFEAAIKDSNPDVLRAAVIFPLSADLLGSMPTGQRTRSIIERLLPLLGDGNPTVQAAVANILGRIPAGDDAVSIVDKLLPLLGNSDPVVQAAAVSTLGQVVAGRGAENVVDKLLPLFRSDDHNANVLAAAVNSVVQIAKSAQAADNALDQRRQRLVGVRHLDLILVPVVCSTNAGDYMAQTALGDVSADTGAAQ